jgi:predicted nucleic acid-binding protein
MAGSSTVPFRIVDSRSRRAYLFDTGVLVALEDDRDGKHEDAVRCVEEIKRLKLPLCVSLASIYETHRRLLHNNGESRARSFLDHIFDGSTTVVVPDPGDEAAAVQWLDYLRGQRITLTDAVNMAIMRRLSLFAVLSFDSDFLIAGFQRVPPMVT